MDIPETSAALILHQDNSIELFLPKGADLDIVPDHVLIVGAIASALTKRMDLIEELMNEVFREPN